ncbi:unnamed protein product [Bursaphelenchus okinawaensis]|uniref:Protein kinase domain-containing protein n=1 Tax=Bursaphelenchus okinawaensis TaxID=465554 RepID=A0A811LLR7_9BILA|nr:unnamed protein product [Bursaphelenchus okinawaensis]CAG9123760.1 unnamed protein product [Bursaphelenchus okinawaensis]
MSTPHRIGTPCRRRASVDKVQQLVELISKNHEDKDLRDGESMEIKEKWDTNLDHLAVCGFFNFGRESDILFCQNRLKKGHVFCALKIRSLSDSQTHFEEIMNEVKIVEMYRHENIAAAYCCSTVSRDVLGIVMPTFLGVKLLLNISVEFGHEHSNEMMIDEVIARQLTYQILKGTAYLHKNGFVHRALNYNSIMLSDEGCVKIGGFSRVIHFDPEVDSLGRTTKPFRPTCSEYHEVAPEMLIPGILKHPHVFPEADRSDEYDIRVDSWAVGCTILHMLFNKRPFSKQDSRRCMDRGDFRTESIEMDIRDWVFRYCDKEAEWQSWRDVYGDKGEKYQKLLSPEFKQFIKDAMRINKLKRWTCEQLLDHKWFKDASMVNIDVAPELAAPECRTLIQERYLSERYLAKMDDLVAETSEKVSETPEEVKIGKHECLITVMTVIKKERYMVRFVVSTRWLEFPKRRLEKIIRTKLILFAESNLLRTTEYIKMTAVAVHLVEKFREEDHTKFIYRCFCIRNSPVHPNFDTLDEMGMVMVNSSVKFSDKVCLSKWPGKELEMDKRFLIQMSEFEKRGSKGRGIFQRMRDRVKNRKKKDGDNEKDLTGSTTKERDSELYQTAPDEQLQFSSTETEKRGEQKKKNRLQQRLRNFFKADDSNVVKL